MGAVEELLGPHRGRCAFCGGPDQRHRVADTIREGIAAGETVAYMADLYELKVAELKVAVEADAEPGPW